MPAILNRASQMAQWVKEFACSTQHPGDAGSSPEVGRSPGGEHGNPLQYP